MTKTFSKTWFFVEERDHSKAIDNFNQAFVFFKVRKV